MKKKKVGFTVFDKDLANWDKLRIWVTARYGTLKGKLGREVIYLALKGLEHEKREKKEKNSVKSKKLPSNRERKLLEIYKKLPDQGCFSEEYIYKILYSLDLHSTPTKRDYINLLEACHMVWRHHAEANRQNPRKRPVVFYEKGKKEELPDWVKGLIEEQHA